MIEGWKNREVLCGPMYYAADELPPCYAREYMETGAIEVECPINYDQPFGKITYKKTSHEFDMDQWMREFDEFLRYNFI